MAIILPYQPSAGERIGTSFGSGLSSGLEALQKLRMEDMLARQQQTRTEKSLEPLFEQVKGTPYEPALRALAKSDPKGLSKMVQNAVLGGFNFGAPQQAQNIPTEGYPEQPTGTSEDIFAQRKTPTPTGDFGEALRRGVYETPALRQQRDIAEAKIKEGRAQEARKESRQRQKEIRKWVSEKEKDQTEWGQARKIASQMKDILLKHSKDFPGRLEGLFEGKLQAASIRNPSVRHYITLADKLVNQLSNTLTGRVTNYRERFVEKSKARIDQPIQTQLDILNDVLEEADRSDMRYGFIEKSRDPKTHDYPEDIQSKWHTYEKALNDPLKYPEEFPVGQRYQDDNGVIHKVIEDVQGNKKWSD